MPLSDPYCSVAQVHAELKNSEADQQLVEQAINQASRWIDRHTRRDYFEHDHTGGNALEIDVHDDLVFGRDLYLPHTPVITINSVIEDSVTLTVNTDWIQKSGRLVRLEDAWTVGEPPDHVIKIDGKFGYDQTGDHSLVPIGLPEYITRACILVAAAFTGKNRQETVGLDGQRQDLINNEIPSAVWEILGRKRAGVIV